MVQASSSHNFDADRLSEALDEGEVEKKEISKGNFDSDYELAQEFSTPESNASGTGSNGTANDDEEHTAFSGSASQPGNPAAYRQMAHDVQPDKDK